MQMCTVLLSPGVNPIAVDKYIISNNEWYSLPHDDNMAKLLL